MIEPTDDWMTPALALIRAGRPAVRVAMAAVRGSAPREAGATLVVAADSCWGTIGGGHLEWKAIEIARGMLAQGHEAEIRTDRFALGATLGQCCGGAVQLWFERFDAIDASLLERASQLRAQGGWLLLSRPGVPAQRELVRADEFFGAHQGQETGPEAPTSLIAQPGGSSILVERLSCERDTLMLFGAGHVGKALVKVLCNLPLRIVWVDSRPEMFEGPVQDNVQPMLADNAVDAVADAPPGAFFLVLTHSHDLDFEICRALLRRGDFAWAGLIGSATKKKRFEQRLAQQGFAPAAIESIVCPIGLPGITSKLPAAIAVGVSAQLLAAMQAHRASASQPHSTLTALAAP